MRTTTIITHCAHSSVPYLLALNRVRGDGVRSTLPVFVQLGGTLSGNLAHSDVTLRFAFCTDVTRWEPTARDVEMRVQRALCRLKHFGRLTQCIRRETVTDLWTERTNTFVCLFSLQEEDRNYKRLTPNQPVGLRHAGLIISVTSVKKVRAQLGSRVRRESRV